MKRRTIALLIAALAPAAMVTAQIKINLDGLAAKAKESVDISLDSSMLQMAAKFLSGGKSDDTKFKQAISSLKNITVRSFEFTQEGQYRVEDLQPIRAQLRGPGWSKIVGTNENGGREITEIYTKLDQGKMAGLAILAAEPKELTIVYIEGSIDLSSLAELGGHLGIPELPIPDLTNKKGKQE